MINIFKHCPKSLQYHNDELWIKTAVSSNSDNPMGSFDGIKCPNLLGAPCYIT